MIKILIITKFLKLFKNNIMIMFTLYISQTYNVHIHYAYNVQKI